MGKKKGRPFAVEWVLVIGDPIICLALNFWLFRRWMLLKLIGTLDAGSLIKLIIQSLIFKEGGLMNKYFAFTLSLLFCLGVLVAGSPELSLAEVNAAGDKCHLNNQKQNIKKVTKDVAGEDALAIFVLKANGDIEVMEGPDPKINFKKPREMQDGQPGAILDKQPNPSKPGEVPDDIKHEMSGNPKVSIIKTYVGDTCANINGTWYCW